MDKRALLFGKGDPLVSALNDWCDVHFLIRAGPSIVLKASITRLS